MKPLLKLLFPAIMIISGMTGFSQTCSVSRTLTLDNDQQPTGLCWDGSYLWMIDKTEDMIRKIDPTTGEILLSFETPDRFSTGLAFDGNHLWCSGDRHNKIYELNLTGQVIRSLEVSHTPRGITCINGSLWYADSYKKHLYKLNPETGEYLDTIQAPGGAARGLAYDGKYLWCSDKDINELYKIDLEHKKIILILPSPDSAPYGLCWDGTALWIAGYNTRDLKRMYTTGTETVLRLDSINAHINYRLAVRNVGSTSMNLRTWISWPSSSLRQKLDSEVSFSPYPLATTSDQWGQQFAYYNNPVSTGDSIVFNMDIDITTYDLRYIILPDEVGTIRDVPATIQNAYMSDQFYFDIHNQIITDAVNEAIGDEINMYWKARKIHDYIISHIHYELDGRWDAAPEILTRGSGSCSEYSYLFIAMCRAAHIPARYEAGAYNGGVLPYVDKVFHRWSQIYLPPYGWVHVDATWDDRTYPANQSRYFGATSKRVFATTQGGGNSNKISWTYNSANSQTGGSRERNKQFTWSAIGSSGIEAIPRNDEVQLHNYPNPFNDQTTISFSLQKPGLVNLRIINLQGVVVKELLSEYLGPGEHLMMWNRANLSPGAYFIQLSTNDQRQSTICIITK